MTRAARRAALCAALALGPMAAPIRAQERPRPAERVHAQARAVIAQQGAIVRLTTTWSADAAETSAEVSGGSGEPVSLHRGSSVVGSLAVGHDRVLIALVVADPQRPFRVHVARAEDGAIEVGEAIEVSRPAGRHLPFAVAIATVPDGFAVFFQEVEERDPTAAHTYLAQLAPDGRPRGGAREVPIPWSLAAAAWNGDGFHLGLVFPGYGDGMRLSMVSTSADGAPQQHPDWASAAGIVEDVHLVARGGRVVAFYRGAGDRLLESDVTAIRGWGTEPPRARDHGALAGTDVIAIDLNGSPRRTRGTRIERGGGRRAAGSDG